MCYFLDLVIYSPYTRMIHVNMMAYMKYLFLLFLSFEEINQLLDYSKRYTFLCSKNNITLELDLVVVK